MPDKTIHARQGQPRHGTAVLCCGKAPFVSLWLLVVALLIGGCSSPRVRHAEGKREGPVVFLGDSLGAGYGVGQDEGFVSLLEKRLGITITNLSQSGITTGDSLPRVKEEVLPLDPALVVIELGGNDALQRVDPAKTRENLASIIKEVQAQGIPVILIGVRGGVISDDYADLFEGLAAEYETGYVADLLDGILTRPELKLDSVHPNAKGHVKLADRVEPEMRRVWASIGGGS
jgi:acyl-CoA thioesterase-1